MASRLYPTTQHLFRQVSMALAWLGVLSMMRGAEWLFRDCVLYPKKVRKACEAINETPIIYQQEGRTVHGIIDRLLLRDDEVWVIDYKSHRHATADNLARLAAPYHEQMNYYAEGMSKLWPAQRVRTFLLFTHCGGLIESGTV